MADPSTTSDAPSTLARSILRRNLQVRPGERVTIEAWPHTLPWAVALARETRRLGAFPLIHYEDEASYWDSVAGGETKILGASPDHEWAELAKTNVYIHMWGPGDRVRLNALSPKQVGDLFHFNEKWYATAKKAGLRGARLEIGRPYPALAKAYGVDEEAWKNQIIAATMVDPSQMAKAAAPIVRALERGKKLRITHENGTDLTLGLAGRVPRASIGRFAKGVKPGAFGMLLGLPDGVVRVALDEKVADGTLVGNRTSYYDDGVATAPTFEFSGGRLTEARFGTGGERFDKPYKKAGKGRDQPGMLAIGLNPQLHDTPQVEDREAGALLVSVGGNQYLGGKNKAAFFGWAIAADATLEVDGKTLPISGGPPPGPGK